IPSASSRAATRTAYRRTSTRPACSPERSSSATRLGAVERFLDHLAVLGLVLPSHLAGLGQEVERIEVEEVLPRLHARRRVDADARRAVVVLVAVHDALAA